MTRIEYIRELERKYPMLSKYSQYIGSRLASNYAIGTRSNASYKDRLEKGIMFVDELSESKLDLAIEKLIADRKSRKGEMDKSILLFRNIESEMKKALILALWSVRIPKMTDTMVNLIDEQVYGNSGYIPHIDITDA